MNEPCYFYEQATMHRYEQLKREWVAAHPDHTPAQYEAAMKALAKRLGL